MLTFPPALASWPAGLVTTDVDTLARYERNVSALARRIAGVARPRDVEDVVALVRAANATGTALYPISTGASWGLGSRAPVRDGAIVVDLGALDRIASLDDRLGVAVIEPGVTQRRLADAVAHTRFRLDVTGSAPETSVLGNALDRGIAHDGPRIAKLRILEVVLGTGERIEFDHAGTTGSIAQLYRWGIGPALHDLFFQSSYGIVTRAAIRLEPRTTAVAALHAELATPARLAAWIDTARELVDRGVLPAALHVSNRARTVSVVGGVLARTLGPTRARAIAERRVPASWSLGCALRGEPEQVRVVERLARRALARFGPVEASHVEPASTSPIGRASSRVCATEPSKTFKHPRQVVGEPSAAGLASFAFTRGHPATAELDAGRTGIVFVLPLVPMAGREVVEALAIVREVVEREHRSIPYVTLNGIGRVFELVLNVTFDRDDPAEVRTAHAAADAVLARLTAAGFPPYRTGIQHMPPASALGLRIKQLLDPRGVLSPGRYE